MAGYADTMRPEWDGRPPGEDGEGRWKRDPETGIAIRGRFRPITWPTWLAEAETRAVRGGRKISAKIEQDLS